MATTGISPDWAWILAVSIEMLAIVENFHCQKMGSPVLFVSID
jgi:hypothetical protein